MIIIVTLSLVWTCVKVCFHAKPNRVDENTLYYKFCHNPICKYHLIKKISECSKLVLYKNARVNSKKLNYGVI